MSEFQSPSSPRPPPAVEPFSMVQRTPIATMVGGSYGLLGGLLRYISERRSGIPYELAKKVPLRYTAIGAALGFVGGGIFGLGTLQQVSPKQPMEVFLQLIRLFASSNRLSSYDFQPTSRIILSNMSEETEIETTYPCSGVTGVQGRRPTMEDSHIVIDDVRKEFPDITFSGEEKIAYYAVYDGHGGHRAAAMCSAHLHKSILNDPAFNEGDVEKAIRNGFASTDSLILSTSVTEGWRDGSTAVVVILVGSTLYIANAGDSEAVLGRKITTEDEVEDKSLDDYTQPTGFQATLLSVKHKPSEPSEKERIKQAGGHVVMGRVMGSLAVARSLGDRDYKHPHNQAEGDFVSAEPYVQKVQLSEKDQFIIVSCDGLWDRTNYQQAVNFVVKRREENGMADSTASSLVQFAIERGSLDNVTAIVVFLTKQDPPITPRAEPVVPPISNVPVDKVAGVSNINVLSPRDLDRVRKHKLPSGEPILEAHYCQLQGKMLHQQGTMLVTPSAILFCYSQFGKKKTKNMCTDQIQSIHFINSLPGIWINYKGKEYKFMWKDGSANMNSFPKLGEMKAKIDQMAKGGNQPSTPPKDNPAAPEGEADVTDDEDGVPELHEDRKEDGKTEEGNAPRASEEVAAVTPNCATQQKKVVVARAIYANGGTESIGTDMQSRLVFFVGVCLFMAVFFVSQGQICLITGSCSTRCTNIPKAKLIHVGVFSTIPRFDQRALLRSTYQNFPRDRITISFVVGKPNNDTEWKSITLENEHHQDIIVLDCDENVNKGKTYDYFARMDKMFRGRYNYVMKTDDDTLIHFNNLISFVDAQRRNFTYIGREMVWEQKHYMQGRGYLLSSDLVEWIRTSSWVEKHQWDNAEDIQTGVWMKEYGNIFPGHDVNWVPTKLFSQKGKMDYDYSEIIRSSKTALIHGLKNPLDWYEAIIELKSLEGSMGHLSPGSTLDLSTNRAVILPSVAADT
ncbi:protein phosphatase 2C [Planoprotostelium fungivorum]|uniref:Protein phosphatase 2C n=1 Tax=Planoprotostelium fungivorum TaxID=1890364 RepID=A0A2P6NBI6_9EUKA|nr:protein phosphatase 2C [Planoprotostelium fungivorum]